MEDYSKAPWTKMALEDVSKPKGGRMCIENHWWAVTNDGDVLFFKGTPQCNSLKSIVERVRPDCTPTFIEFAFVPHNCADY